MKGVKIIRTSNWDAMTHFYAKLFGVGGRQQDDNDSVRLFADFGTEIHLERVRTPAEHEVVGSLELYSIDPDGLASYLSKKSFSPEKRSVGGHTELLLSDPDGHVITIVPKPDKT
jgi:catechol 2,3-dioxygenase-like lactoylglutathione lyase family enzyme